MSIDPCRDRLCLATEDGILIFYSFTDKNVSKLEPRELKRMNTNRIWDQWTSQFDDIDKEKDVDSISSLPSWKSNSTKVAQQKVSQSHFSESIRIISLYYFLKSDSNTNQHQNQYSYILICCSVGLIIMESHTFTIVYIFDFLRNGYSTIDFFSFNESFTNHIIRIGCVNTFCHEGILFDLKEFIQRNPLDTIGDMIHLALNEFILKSIENRVKGKWAWKIYQECLAELAKVGIRQWDSLLSASELPASIPYYVHSDLLDYISYKDSENNDYMIDLYLKTDSKDTHLAAILSKSLQIKPKSKPTLNSMNKPVTFHTKVKSSGYMVKLFLYYSVGYRKHQQFQKCFNYPKVKNLQTKRFILLHILIVIFLLILRIVQ